MLVIVVEIRVPEGMIAAVTQTIADMENASRQEPGCHTYAFSVDVNDPGMLRITERWESKADLEAHFLTPHMATFGAALAKYRPLSLDAHAYEIASEFPLPGA